MKFFEQTAISRRPAWMVLVMALPIGVLANTFTGGLANLPDALLALLGWQHEPTMLQRWLVKTVCHVVFPWVLAYAVLRLTRLGDWLVPNRLALAALMGADVLFCGHAVWRLVMACTGGLPFLTGAANTLMGAALTTCVVVGLSSLAASTVWHRLIRDSDKARQRLTALLQEV